MKSALLALLLAAPLAAQSDSHALYVPFNDVTLLSSGAAHVVINGNAVIDAPLTTIALTTDPLTGQPKGVGSTMLLQAAVMMDITSDAAGTVNETLPLTAAPLAPFSPSFGLFVTPWVVVLVTVSGQTAADLHLSFVQEYGCEAAVSVGPGYHTSVSQDSLVQRGGGPEEVPGSDAHLQVATTFAVVLLSSFQSTAIGGPLLGVTLSADLEVVSTFDPWWEMSGSVSPVSGYWGLGAPLIFDPPVFALIANAGGSLALAPPGTRWSVALDAGASESARGVMPSADGFTVTARSSFADEHVAQLDRQGALITSNVSANAANGFGQAVVTSRSTADGGQLVLGNGAGGVRLDRLDAAGFKLWSRVYAHDLAIVPGAVDLAVLPDGGCFVLGQAVLTASPAATRPFVLRVDPAGDVLWARDLIVGATTPGAQPVGLAATADGECLLTGTVVWGEADALGQPVIAASNLLLAKLDANGDLVFAEIFGSIGNESGACVAEGADGLIWVGGTIAEGPSSYGWLSSFQPDGALRWTLKLHGDDTGLFSNGLVALEPVDGGVQLLGLRSFGPARDAWLAVVSDDGTPLMWKTLGGADEDTPLGLRVIPDGILAWGFTRSLAALGLGTSQDEWVVRTSVDGMMEFDPDTGFTAHNDLVHWDQPVNAFTTAKQLVPTVSAATITVSDKPLPFAPLAVTETKLED